MIYWSRHGVGVGGRLWVGEVVHGLMETRVGKSC